MKLSEYAATLYQSPDELLERIPIEAQAEGLPPIHIPDEIGRLLQVLIVSTDTRRILELGTLFGYSTIWMARALPDDGHIVTLEAAAKHADLARRNLDAAGVSGKVEIRQGPALETLPVLADEQFDMIFIDADKVNYVNYLNWALRLSRPGSVIVADNTWRQGDVAALGGDDNARAMAEFNCLVAGNGNLYSTIVPTRDGDDALTLAVVR